MGKAKKTRRFALVKRLVNPKDDRLKAKELEAKRQKERSAPSSSSQIDALARHVPQVDSSLFFEYNSALSPPYQVIIDTNFINFCIRNKLDLMQAMLDCLYAKAIPCITDCVMAELEKLGSKYRVALRIARDPRFERLTCTHKGTYADDCIVQRVQEHKCYIVATNDKALKQRIRKIPGIPIMYVGNHKLQIEKLVDLH